MSLNEQLAELCGYRLIQHESQGDWLTLGHGDDIPYRSWNPTTDLNQLRMRYEALSKIEKLRLALLLDDNPVIVFTDPELIAQDILKAKGVS